MEGRQSEHDHGYVPNPAFQYDAEGHGNYVPHGAIAYYEEHFIWNDASKNADEISLNDAREDFKYLDEASFLKRKDDWTPGVHLPPPYDANSAHCIEWYVDMETECWLYAGEAYAGMCR